MSRYQTDSEANFIQVTCFLIEVFSLKWSKQIFIRQKISFIDIYLA